MSKNPLEGMAKFYEKCVKKADEKGFADLYKHATELLFERLKEETDMDLHFEDVNYLDGYFIFGYGTNSVVHFHVKEAPGWLFGVWWSPVPTDETKDKKKKEYKTDRLFCDFFFQFEKEIDKFKPTASMFGESFEFMLNESYISSGWLNACKDLEFVIKEPYLAFYREMHYTNFNHEYVSREKAKNYWNRHWKEREKQRQLGLANAKAMFETFKYIIGPVVKDGLAFIYDRGHNVSPRYEVVIKNVKFDDNKYYAEEDGCYYLFEDYDDAKKDEKLYKKTEKECAKREGCKYYFGNPFSKHCMIVKAARYDKWLSEAIDDGKALYYRKEDGTLFEGEVLKDD